MFAEGVIGPIVAADGAGNKSITLTRTGNLRAGDAQSHFAEQAMRGNLYSAALTAGVAPGTALGTTAPLALWNPPNSGVKLVIVRWTFGWASGTLGAGKLWHVLHDSSAATPGGSVVTVFNNNGASGGGQGKAFSTATGLGAAHGMRMAATITALAADAGTSAIISEVIDGEYSVPEGGAYSLQEVGAAGTSPTVLVGIEWEELPK